MAAALLSVPAPVSAVSAEDPHIPEEAGGRLYVASQAAAAVSILDMDSHEVLETIWLTELGFTPDAKPHHIAVEPDGSAWYVSLIGDNKVLKFDRDNRLVGQVEFERPGMLAVHPTRDLLFVGRSMAAVNPPQRIGIIRRSDMAIEELDVFFPRPHAIVVHPDGDHLYTASLAENRLASLEIESEELELSGLGEGPPAVLVQFAVSPDGQTLVGTGQLTSKLLVFDLADPMAPSRTHSIDVNAAPWHPAFSPDGRYVYFGNQNANTVTVVETDGWTVDAVIEGEGLAEPHGVATSSDGRYLYVSNRNQKGAYSSVGNADEHPGTVVVIDTSSREIIAVIEVAPYAAGMSASSPK